MKTEQEIKDKEQKDGRLKDKIDYMEEYIKTVENARNDLERELEQKEQECEELKEKVKKYGEINEQETKDYAELKAENEELIRKITKIFACLIKANRTNKIVDTIWVDNITTLWDYIAQTLEIEGDQVQIEEQILQKISECEVNNDR